MFSKRKISIICLAVSVLLLADGCKKKAPAPAPPPPPAPVVTPAPPPPPAAPGIAQFTAEPSSIQRGESSVLRWEVSGTVSSVAINQGVGTVQAAGNSRVSPASSTTYTLTATGPGGTQTASATVSVVTPPPPPPPPPPAAPQATMEQRIHSDVQDAFFDYDKSDIRGDARDALTRDAGALKAILADFPTAAILLEGHCDERGSAEYNLGLGDRRSTSAKEFLESLGVPADRLRTISYGKERPQCTDADEACYQKNRRVHFAPGQ
ncbi:MAG: OmpA family protein [Bryobacteraceae bacterium]